MGKFLKSFSLFVERFLSLGSNHREGHLVPPPDFCWKQNMEKVSLHARHSYWNMNSIRKRDGEETQSHGWWPFLLGTNWMAEILGLIRQDGDPSWVRSTLVWDRMPWLETTGGQEVLSKYPAPRLMSCHMPCQLFPKSFLHSKAKVRKEKFALRSTAHGPQTQKLHNYEQQRLGILSCACVAQSIYRERHQIVY